MKRTGKARGSPARGISDRETKRRCTEVVTQGFGVSYAVECALLLARLPTKFGRLFCDELRKVYTKGQPAAVRRELLCRWALAGAVADLGGSQAHLIGRAVRVMREWPLSHLREIVQEMERSVDEGSDDDRE